MVNLKRAFDQQRKAAKFRGIPFLFTYEEWLAVWLASGHLDERGRYRDGYVMARLGDRGPYAPGNIHIITHAENIAEAYRSAETRHKMSQSKIGKPLSAEHRQAISTTTSGANNHFHGKTHSAEARAKMRAAKRRS
jgi:hypothetical protein